MSKISNQLSLNLLSEITLSNFSFSQLIVAVKSLMDAEGVPGLIKAMLILVESLLIKSGVSCPHCSCEKFHFHSKSERSLKTTIGEVRLILKRVACQECGKTYCPLNKLMDLDAYSRKSREFEKLGLETITNQSFRRSAKHLADTLGFTTAHTTLHRWFQNTDATNMNLKNKVDFLAADGTGFKKEKDESGSNRGEVRVIIGYNKSGEVIPFGAWTRARDLVPESNMPAYPWLEKAALNPSSIAAHMRALRLAGVPYSEEDIQVAYKETDGTTEEDALVAYLQGLGTSLKSAR